jgi:hypothetical protein
MRRFTPQRPGGVLIKRSLCQERRVDQPTIGFTLSSSRQTGLAGAVEADATIVLIPRSHRVADELVCSWSAFVDRAIPTAFIFWLLENPPAMP